jgi:lysozyme
MTLIKGSRGPEVMALQGMLVNRGYKSVVPDGDFGGITEAAVKDFQAHVGVQADGVVTDDLMLKLQGTSIGDGVILGVDVSYWQANVDWVKVRQSGVQFAYVKCSEASARFEPRASAQATGAIAANLQVGYYHFAGLNDPNVVADADKEALFFHSCMQQLPSATLLPVLDLETNKSNLSPALVQRWVTEFVAKMTELGHNVMLYSYAPFLDQYLPHDHPFGSMPLWLAQYRNVDYPSMPNGWNSYSIWQYSNTGAVNGIGQCDVNKTTVLPLINPAA